MLDSMRWPAVLPPFVACLPLLVACGAKGDAESQTADSEAGTGSGGDAEEEATAGTWEPELARGIHITEVEANQGTRVEIALADQWVDGTERRTFLANGRDTLIRVHFDLDEEWIPREIEARLNVQHADGTRESYSHAFMVEVPSDPRWLDHTFFWGLVADEGQTEPGTKFQVELWETGPGGEALEPGLNVSPDQPNWVGFESDRMEMNVMFVPIVYMGTEPEITDDDRAFIIDRIHEHNPLQIVHTEFHDPYAHTTTLDDISDLLSVMNALQTAEGNNNGNVYYSALLDYCVESDGGGCGTGVARLGETSPFSSDLVNVIYWRGLEDTANTIVHEIGHNQALRHVACPNPGQDAANPDPTYPHPDGETMNRGFGVRTFRLYDDDDYDYMSYCEPSWVSDWTWAKTFFRIQVMTEWEHGSGFAAPPTQPLLRGQVSPDGRNVWWIEEGALDKERISGHRRVTFDLDGDKVAQLAVVQPISDSEVVWVSTPLPANFERVRGIRYESEDLSVAIDPTQLDIRRLLSTSPS